MQSVIGERQLLAGTGSPARRQQADLGGQGPRDTKVSFLTLARLSAPGQQPTLPTSCYRAVSFIASLPNAGATEFSSTMPRPTDIGFRRMGALRSSLETMLVTKAQVCLLYPVSQEAPRSGRCT